MNTRESILKIKSNGDSINRICFTTNYTYLSNIIKLDDEINIYKLINDTNTFVIILVLAIVKYFHIFIYNLENLEKKRLFFSYK